MQEINADKNQTTSEPNVATAPIQLPKNNNALQSLLATAPVQLPNNENVSQPSVATLPIQFSYSNAASQLIVATSPVQLASSKVSLKPLQAQIQLSKTEKVTNTLASTLPNQSSTASTESQIAATVAPAQPKPAATLPNENATFQLPDISKPPPNFAAAVTADNLSTVQLPDLTQLPPSLINKCQSEPNLPVASPSHKSGTVNPTSPALMCPP